MSGKGPSSACNRVRGKLTVRRMPACQQFNAMTRHRDNLLLRQRVFAIRPLPFFTRRSLIASIITSWVVISASRPTSLIMR